jgi:hypothetical protein
VALLSVLHSSGGEIFGWCSYLKELKMSLKNGAVEEEEQEMQVLSFIHSIDLSKLIMKQILRTPWTPFAPPAAPQRNAQTWGKSFRPATTGSTASPRLPRLVWRKSSTFFIVLIIAYVNSFFSIFIKY